MKTSARFSQAPSQFAGALFLLAIFGGTAAADDLASTAAVVRGTPVGTSVARPAVQATPARQATQATQARQAVQATPPRAGNPSRVVSATPEVIQVRPAPSQAAPRTVPALALPRPAIVDGTAVLRVPQESVVPIQRTTPRTAPIIEVPSGAPVRGTQTTPAMVMLSPLNVDRNTIQYAPQQPMLPAAGQPQADGYVHAPPSGVAAPSDGHADVPNEYVPHPQAAFPVPGMAIPAQACCEPDGRAARGRQDAQGEAHFLLNQPAHQNPSPYGMVRTHQDEMNARDALIGRLAGATKPVQGLTLRNDLWLQPADGRPITSVPGVDMTPRGVGVIHSGGTLLAAGAAGQAQATGPCEVKRNPEFDAKLAERDRLVREARDKKNDNADVIHLERAIQSVERELDRIPPYLDNCGGEHALDANNEARKQAMPGGPVPQSDGDQFADEVRRERANGAAPGRTYYERKINPEGSFDDLPDAHKRRLASSEQSYLDNSDLHMLQDWQRRLAALEDADRAAESAARRAESDAKLAAIEAEQQAADRRTAARLAREQRERNIETLKDNAKALNAQLRAATASGNTALQRTLEHALDAINQELTNKYTPLPYEQRAMDAADQRRVDAQQRQRAAAEQQAVRDERQAHIDKQRDIEQQNANVFTRGTNFAAGVGLSIGKAALEVPLTAVDVGSALTSGAPKQSALGKAIESSSGPIDFGQRVVSGVGGTFENGWRCLTTGDMRGLGEATTDITTMVGGGAQLVRRAAAKTLPGAARNSTRSGAQTVDISRMSAAERRAVNRAIGDAAMDGAMGRRQLPFPDDLDDLPPPSSVPAPREPGSLSAHLGPAERARLRDPNAKLTRDEANLLVDMNAADALARLKGQQPGNCPPPVPGWNDVPDGSTFIDPKRAGRPKFLDEQ